MALVRNVPQEPSGHQGRVGSVNDCAAAVAWRLSRPGCPIFSLPLDADAFGVEKTGFARKLAARPQGAGGGCAMGRGLRILVSGSGGLGLRQGDGGASVAQWFMPRHGHAGRCPDPPRNLRFLGFSFCCRLFDRTSLRTQSQAQAVTTTAQRRRLALCPHQKRTPAVKRRPPARRPRRLNAAAVGCRLSLPTCRRRRWRRWRSGGSRWGRGS